MAPAFAGSVLNQARVEDQGFDRRLNSGGVAVWVKDLETDLDDCFCAIHMLPCLDGWIVEIWNWQVDCVDSPQKVALPRLFQTTAELSTFLRLVSRNQPAKGDRNVLRF